MIKFKKVSMGKAFLSIVLLFAIFQVIALSSALTSVSQLGFHPQSNKQVVVYTSSTSGTFSIVRSETNQIVLSRPLIKARNYNGAVVECQGNNPCLIGDFSNFTEEGNYFISTSLGENRPLFSINSDIYSENAPVFLEFFDAQQQQGSDYHQDMHSDYSLPFTAIADGSFIMESPQAAKTLIRLGSAYRRNPNLLPKEDMQEAMKVYVDYLVSLQGLEIEKFDYGEANYDSGFRLIPDLKIKNIFVPNETNLTTLDVGVYDGEDFAVTDSDVPVVSLCGGDDGSSAWETCIEDAEKYYKCQPNEPCLNQTYIEQTGRVSGNNGGYGVATGWSVEFGCYIDIDLEEPLFNGDMDPCLVFIPKETRENTAESLLGFLEAIPAMYDSDPKYAKDLYLRSKDTAEYIENNFPAFKAGDEDAGYFGASLFLLYDYSKNADYLRQAHGMRGIVTPDVSSVFISDGTRGSEFYWEEYVRHKDDIGGAGLIYAYKGNNPEDFFQNKIFNDWKDRGQYSMSNNGERVFQFDNNIQFQNSRYMLTEGLLAAKTEDLRPNSESFVQIVADNQLSWLAGMNAVQDGVELNTTLRSYSFIFGIAESINPSAFHSRYLINTGLRDSTNGKIIGARSTGKQFFNGTDYIYFDGRTEILGKVLGSLGNSYNDETEAEIWTNPQFNNGEYYIPGWINGVFDVKSEDDDIFNYADTPKTYEFTESTNEMAATGIELFSYLDALYNNKSAHEGVVFDSTQINSTLTITSRPSQADVFVNNIYYGKTPLSNISLAAGAYQLNVSLLNYESNTTYIKLIAGSNTSISFALKPINSSNTTILSSSTNLPKNQSSSRYYMNEENKSFFSLELNKNSTIYWKVNGNIASTTSGLKNNFTWNPGILYTESAASAVISAETDSGTLIWDVDVYDTVNPFFSPDSGDSGQIHVFTNDLIQKFTALEVSIQSTEGSNVIIKKYSLTPTKAIRNQTDWGVFINDFNYGANYLVEISGNISNNNRKTYPLLTNGSLYRAFYKPFPNSPAIESPGGSSGGGGGGTSSREQTFDLIYVLLEKDVVHINESQGVTLDARSNAEIKSVSAIFIGPEGNILNLPLALTGGDESYGTWKANFSPAKSGLYVLQYAEIKGISKSSRENVTGRSFYYIGNSVADSEKLMLVYTILSDSIVNDVTNVSLKLDARDSGGIESISALIEVKNGDNTRSFILPLKLISGSKLYGSWEGAFLAEEPDTTYTIKSISLSNNDETKEYIISDRSVYATDKLPITISENRNFLTGNIIASGNLTKNALAPLIIGLAAFVLIYAVTIIIIRFRRDK